MTDEIPPASSLRWPVLVVLDGLGEDEILDLEDRVAMHLALSADARAIVDPDTRRALVTQRLMQAIEDLYQADAVEPDEEGGSIRITESRQTSYRSRRCRPSRGRWCRLHDL